MKIFLPFWLVFLASACKTVPTNSVVRYKLRIEKGDSLPVLASKYDTSIQAIASLNNLGAFPILKAGQIIIVQPGPRGLRSNSNISDPAANTLPALDQPTEPSRGGLLFGNRTNSPPRHIPESTLLHRMVLRL
jgi:hypothetical protein